MCAPHEVSIQHNRIIKSHELSVWYFTEVLWDWRYPWDVNIWGFDTAAVWSLFPGESFSASLQGIILLQSWWKLSSCLWSTTFQRLGGDLIMVQCVAGLIALWSKSQVARSLQWSIVQVFSNQNEVGSKDAQPLYTDKLYKKAQITFSHRLNLLNKITKVWCATPQKLKNRSVSCYEVKFLDIVLWCSVYPQSLFRLIVSHSAFCAAPWFLKSNHVYTLRIKIHNTHTLLIKSWTAFNNCSVSSRLSFTCINVLHSNNRPSFLCHCFVITV